jgi:uncharacterized protein YciI
MKNTYLVFSKAGPKRDLSKGSREQQFWDDHATFIDGLVEEGFILMGGPFDDGGAMLIVRAEDEQGARSKLASDPWYVHDILVLDSIKRWNIFIDQQT